MNKSDSDSMPPPFLFHSELESGSGTNCRVSSRVSGQLLSDFPYMTSLLLMVCWLVPGHIFSRAAGWWKGL